MFCLYIRTEPYELFCDLSIWLQLVKELKAGCVFDGWMEGPIDFPPTYKYEINSDKYLGDEPKEGEKKRSPAW